MENDTLPPMDQLTANSSANEDEYVLFNKQSSIDMPAVVTDISSIHITATNPIEAILPRHQIYQFVQLFFDYIYPLTPCVHPPSIWRDLRARREEREGENEWTHMILSLVASTLAQLPKFVNKMPIEQCLSVIDTCWTSVTTYLREGAENGTIDRSEFIYLRRQFNVPADQGRRHIIFVRPMTRCG